MRKNINKLVLNLNAAISDISYCFLWAWRSSHTYTLVRLFNKMLLPFLGIALTIIGKHIIDLLSGTILTENNSNLITFLVLECGIGILVTILTKIDEYTQSIHSEILIKDISDKMMIQSINADMEFFDDASYYDSFEAAKRDMQSVVNVMWNSINCISLLVTFLVTFFIVCRVNVLYAILIVFSSVPSSIVNKIYSKVLYNMSVDQINDNRKLSYFNYILTSKAFAADIKLYQIGDYIKQQYLNLWLTMFSFRKKKIKKKSFLVTILNVVPNVVKLIIMLKITLGIMNGKGTIGDYVLYIGIMGQLIGSVNGLFMSIIQIYDDKLRIDNVKAFDKYKNHIINSGSIELEEVKRIEFNSVDFMYPGTHHNVLDKVGFIIEQGEKVALVGINGSGKSTIIKLLLRFYDVTAGSILINGIDLREYEIKSLRKVFSVCFQNPTIYGFSLRENIVISDVNVFNGNDEKVYNALFESDANSIIDQTTKGLDVNLGRYFDNEGIELSGGQYQKISLARTFYRDAKVNILDEPSSSLDPEAENEIFNKMVKLSNDRTTLFTSHRLSNIFIADKIIVIEDGKVIEQGTHKQLMANASRYSILYNYQAEKYMID